MAVSTRYLTQKIAKVLVWVGALSTIAVMLLILLKVLSEGLPSLGLRFFFDSPKEMGREGGILPMILGTAALQESLRSSSGCLGSCSLSFISKWDGPSYPEA